MTEYIIRRFLGLIPTLFIIITLSFFIIRFAPGGPLDTEKALPAQILENIERKFHLDEPLFKQYVRYLGGLLRGDLGPSYRYMDRNVNDFLLPSLPHSMLLAGCALLFAVTLGILMGMTAAVYRNSWIDYTIMVFAVFGISVPLIVLGPLFQYFFALRLQWFPTSGWITGRHGWITLIMPVIALSLHYIANITRLMRASTIEMLQHDFVRTARAKGLSMPTIMRRHVFKGSLLPVTSYLGPAAAALVTGSVIAEQIFRIPGIGKFFLLAAFNRDYTMIVGTVIIYSTILIILNFVVDLLYGLLDPRITYK